MSLLTSTKPPSIKEGSGIKKQALFMVEFDEPAQGILQNAAVLQSDMILHGIDPTEIRGGDIASSLGDRLQGGVPCCVSRVDDEVLTTKNSSRRIPRLRPGVLEKPKCVLL